MVDQHLFINIIHSSFTARTRRKVWCDWGPSVVVDLGPYGLGAVSPTVSLFLIHTLKTCSKRFSFEDDSSMINFVVLKDLCQIELYIVRINYYGIKKQFQQHLVKSICLHLSCLVLDLFTYLDGHSSPLRFVTIKPISKQPTSIKTCHFFQSCFEKKRKEKKLEDKFNDNLFEF